MVDELNQDGNLADYPFIGSASRDNKELIYVDLDFELTTGLTQPCLNRWPSTFLFQLLDWRMHRNLFT
ncbi:hypothetical protein AAULR_15248 [Lacticaseibacillus rhamnosus MTCC 5462]|nr:hypothetical protein AAULR_15248 [Lacticaseibacillus rhamnosus MTCC 5462]